MNSIPKRLLISSSAVLVLLLGLNLWLWPNQGLQRSATSLGIMRDGYKAAFDLLSELHFPVTRSYRRPTQAPTNETIWLIAPSFLEVDKPSAHEQAHEVVEWASRGGTAVIFGDAASDWEILGLTREAEENKSDENKSNGDDEVRFFITGDPLPRPRWLETPNLIHFTDRADKKANPHSNERVLMAANGKPFALQMTVGKHGGRIIAIADDSFLRNEHLADADASVLVVDLARGFGAPVFDEYSHGLAPPSSLTFAILDSRAILPLILGLLVAMLWVYSQRIWPRRSIEDDSAMPAPSIASFVESLSILYSRAGDPGAVFRAYRAGFLRRLRRQIGVRADYPEDLLKERIARDRSLPEETRNWLLASYAPGDQHHLVNAVRAIESYPKMGTGRHENRA